MSTEHKHTTIKALYVYPIKSCRGISVKETTLTRQGLRHDRKWMFVDANNKFMTIRDKSEMTLIRTAFDDKNQNLVVTFPAHKDAGLLHSAKIEVPLDPSKEYIARECKKIDVNIWGIDTDAYTYTSSTVTSAVSNYFKALDPTSDVKLVTKGPTPRQAQGNGAPENLGRKESVNFPDVLPILVANMKSLDDINRRLKERDHYEITIERYRPNVIVEGEGMEAWEEDRWKTLRFNPVPSSTSTSTSSSSPSPPPPSSSTTKALTTFQTLIFWLIANILNLPWLLPHLFPSLSHLPNTLPIDVDVAARCTRCHVPNVDPDTGIADPAKEPWTLTYTYRRVDSGFKYKPCFGMLCCPRSEGGLAVGGTVEVKETMKEGTEHVYIKGF